MNSEQQQRDIIAKFKRNSHSLTKKALGKALQYLHGSSNFPKKLDLLVKKFNQISFSDPHLGKQQTIKNAVQMLTQTNSKFKNYDQVIEDVRRWCLCSIGPYENSEKAFFVERPSKEMFEFHPADKMSMHLKQYKKIYECNKDVEKRNNTFMGVFFENYSMLSANSKPRLIIQNEVNQILCTIPNELVPECLVLPGCTYIVEGAYTGKESLLLTVERIVLPGPAQEEKSWLMRAKFRQMCHSISSAKESIQFSALDFHKYDTIYNQQRDPNRPLIIFGNISINKSSVQRVFRLISAYHPTKVYGIVFMMAEDGHESINLTAWFTNIKVFVVPHINSEGPRLLPKLPVLKYKFNARVLTNPARLCVDGRDVMIVNYPLLRNIYTKSLMQQQLKSTKPETLIGKAAELIFSQNSVAIEQDIYWKQHDYFNISGETILVVCDSSIASHQHRLKGKDGKVQKEGKGIGLISTGNFQREGDFVCLVLKSKNPVQFCQEPKE